MASINSAAQDLANITWDPESIGSRPVVENMLYVDDPTFLKRMKGEAVLCRLEINAPLKEVKTGDGESDFHMEVEDNSRLVQVARTLSKMIEAGATPIVAGHVNRGKDPIRDNIRPVAEELAKLVDGCKELIIIEDPITNDAFADVMNAKKIPGCILVVQNTRLHPWEQSKVKSEQFNYAAGLAQLAPLFVGDAMGAYHRDGDATIGILPYLYDSKLRAAGFGVRDEVDAFKRYKNTEGPELIIMAGQKIEDKSLILKKLIEKAIPGTTFFLGGGVGYAMFEATTGICPGRWFENVEEHDASIKVAREIAELLRDKALEVMMPQTYTITNLKDKTLGQITWNVAAKDIGQNIPVGVGESDLLILEQAIAKCSKILWNGPLEWYENKNVSGATDRVGRAVLAATNLKAAFIGGGNTISALSSLGDVPQHIYLGKSGGASLEFFAMGDLPGLAAMRAI